MLLFLLVCLVSEWWKSPGVGCRAQQRDWDGAGTGGCGLPEGCWGTESREGNSSVAPPELIPSPTAGPCNQPQVISTIWRQGTRVRTRPNHSSLNSLQLLRCKPHQSEKQRPSAAAKAKLITRRPAPNLIPTRSEVTLASGNPGHEG